MDEIKREILSLIVEYNHVIKNNIITSISISDKIDPWCEINTSHISASYTISYDDGSCQTWSSYESMKYYLKGMIDGFMILKKEYDEN